MNEILSEVRIWMESRGVTVESDNLIPAALKYEYELMKERCQSAETILRAKEMLLKDSAKFIVSGIGYTGPLTISAGTQWLAKLKRNVKREIKLEMKKAAHPNA